MKLKSRGEGGGGKRGPIKRGSRKGRGPLLVAREFYSRRPEPELFTCVLRSCFVLASPRSRFTTNYWPTTHKREV
eukprot:scaffold25166_cov79-Cyclotella_meneghiniana.AAC.5